MGESVPRAASNFQIEDAIQGQVGGQHESARWIGLDHVRMYAVVAADGEAAGRGAGRMRRADRTLVVLDVGGRAQFAAAARMGRTATVPPA